MRLRERQRSREKLGQRDTVSSVASRWLGCCVLSVCHNGGRRCTSKTPGRALPGNQRKGASECRKGRGPVGQPRTPACHFALLVHRAIVCFVCCCAMRRPSPCLPQLRTQRRFHLVAHDLVVAAAVWLWMAAGVAARRGVHAKKQSCFKFFTLNSSLYYLLAGGTSPWCCCARRSEKGSSAVRTVTRAKSVPCYKCATTYRYHTSDKLLNTLRQLGTLRLQLAHALQKC